MNLNEQFSMIVHTAVAMLLGGIVGFEREAADKPAGFRTHMLVAGAAALLVVLGDTIVERFAAEAPAASVRTDPVRIVEAIITGISFLGAGTIFRRGKREAVEGLTTAASLLLVGALGIAIALDQYLLAFSVTALTLIVLRGMWRIQEMSRRRKNGVPGEERK